MVNFWLFSFQVSRIRSDLILLHDRFDGITYLGDECYHWEVRMSETMSPYKAKASPKIKIRIIPTKIFSCWAFALTPASPTIPIDSPAAYIRWYVPANWSRSKGLMPSGHSLTYRCNHHQLNSLRTTSLDDNDSHDHAVNTQDTGHDHGHDWLHDEFRLQDTHGANTNTSFGWSVSSTEVGEDEGWGDTDVSEEVLGHVDWEWYVKILWWTDQLSDRSKLYGI